VHTGKETQADTLIEALWHWADVSPDAVAYAAPGGQLTYRQLRDDALRWAALLAARGLAPGSRCALLLPSGLDFVRGLFGVQWLGAVPLIDNPNLPGPTLTGRLRAARCDMALTSEAEAAALDAGIPVAVVEELAGTSAGSPAPSGRPRPEDVALLQATSGTTGEPRTALILHRNLVASARASRGRLQVRPDDVLVNWVPLYHSLGLVRFVIGGCYFGCPVHLVPPGLGNLKTWLATIARVRGTITGAPDFGYRAAAELVPAEGLDLTSLRYAMNSGEPIRLATIERFEQKFGVPGVIRPGYGLAEANGVCYFAPGEPLRQDAAGIPACGRPADGLVIEIVDDDGRPLPAGTAGEIRVRGPQVFAGYADDEEATRQKLHDGWLHTGDVGRLDADGYLYVEGRKRALIKRGGAALAPGLVEAAAERVPGVRRAAAIGVERATRLGSEDLVLVVEIESPQDPAVGLAALATALTQAVTIAIGFAPAEVILLGPPGIPCTPTGKVRHEELKQHLLSGQLARSGAILHGKPCVDS
jgi:acyl-CoA synthetase (AMP-forming)/AMP-acid ligase II